MIVRPFRVAPLLAALGLAVPHSYAAAPAQPVTLTLTGPSVVIFHATSAEIATARAEQEPEQLKAFNAEFSAGSTRLVAALKAHPAIKVISSSADVVRFSDTTIAPVWRYSVPGGHGYLFYRPGAPLRVFAGVRNADGLICEAARMFELKPAPPHCDPLPGR